MAFGEWLADWGASAVGGEDAIVPENDLERQYLQEGIGRAIGSIGTATQSLVSHTQTLHLWLLASLLTLNGGAAIAILSSDKIQLAYAAEAMAAYVLGCVLAVSTALISTLSAGPIGRLMGDALDHLIYDAKLVQVRPETRASVQRCVRFARRINAIAASIGVLALAAFSWGSLSMLCRAQ